MFSKNGSYSINLVIFHFCIRNNNNNKCVLIVFSVLFLTTKDCYGSSLFF